MKIVNDFTIELYRGEEDVIFVTLYYLKIKG